MPLDHHGKGADQLLPSIELIRATREQEPVLANLLELYIHDLSEFVDLEIGPDGRFGYERLPLYWSEPGRHPFLLKVGGKLAGFVLVSRGQNASGDGEVWDVAEFFVLRGFRRKGVGMRAAHEVWRRFPGWWEVRVMGANAPARAFWARAITNFTRQSVSPISIEKDGKAWLVFSFRSGDSKA